MARTYTPDAWVILEIKSAKYGNIKKVLAGWYGGYLGADEWRLSSGITDVTLENDTYVITQDSGSIYYCTRSAERMTGLMSNLITNYQKSAAKLGASVTVIPFENILTH